MRFLFSLGVFLLAAATIFALNNPDAVTLKFLIWKYPTTLALAVLGAAVLGGLIVYIVSLLSHGGLRARLRSAEARLREWELERTARSEPAGTPPRT